MQQEQTISMPENAVAIIGAGPGGLAAGRWLRAHGFEPVIFEAAARVGGQWNSASASSATWPGMRTNTSRVMTAFSDLDHAPGTPVYPTQEDMLDYLERYAFTTGLLPHLRLSTRVEALERAPEGGWLVRSVAGGRIRQEVFKLAIVASGRHRTPQVPEVPGLDTFSGSLGAVHAAQYNGVERYRGRKVLVAGCSISALEIASELAYGGAAKVVVANRRQRYVLPKLIAGVPTEHVMFNRASALLGAVAPPEALAAGLKAKVLSVAGNPAQFGAPAPDENIFAAGITQSHHFLPAVAEGRITVAPWIRRIEGGRVLFEDGSAFDADGIIFGTGYRLSLPWLEADIAKAVDLDETHLDLHDHSFHPDLPGLAFLGLYDLVGPYLPVLELQARWISYCFAGLRPMPSQAEMREGVARSRAMRAGPPSMPMNAAALMFAARAGVEPDPAEWPELERALLFGPLSAVSFRLTGPDALGDAEARSRQAAEAFGAITGSEFTAEEHGICAMIGRQQAISAA
ncbi:MAG: dimethylaniline monooxygenase [Rhizobium sp.]|nr:MAG: dimethylaniline monooxygenase [Rhizobium sp.]